MAEVVGSAAVEVGKCAWPHLKEHVGYLMHFNDNVKNLKDRVQDLMARKEHIDRLVSPDHSNGEEETPEVRLWLTRAAKMIQEAATIQQKVAENKGCVRCLNLKWRYSKSKQAKQTTKHIVRHYEDGNQDKMKMTMPPSLPTVINEEAPSIQGLPSVESSLQEVMSALRDENTKIIGVWGMGGVGKTTLMKNVNNELQGTQRFNKVIMVIVSEDVDIKRIQGDIAKRLGFRLRDGTESSQASDLRNRLMQEKKFLIILDDLWERLDLAAVGIPSTNSLEGCKIIFTTRNKDVCKGMESQVDIQVKVLLEEESWKLFKEKAGDVVDDPSLHTKAREVFKECAGLPLAIITLGRALRGERDPRVWDNALSQLKKSAPRNIKEMEKGVYQSIKISYERLQAELKLGFLFCCLFPEDFDIHVDRMISFWKGEGFLEDVESLEEALNKGHALVEELKSSCLLLAGSEEGYVKMHDIVRDVAIWISSEECKDCKSFVRIGLKGLPQGKSWEEYKRISLRGCGINKLPEGMHCPKLVTLMMPENKQPIEIHGWFWEATKDLRALDLSRTAISKIPVLSNLVNLRVLCLRSCKFEEGNCLSALGALKQLEFLDLSFNDWLCELPNEIGELVNLRSLDLTNTVHLKIVPSGVISRLTLLEELKMWKSFHQWKAEEKDASSSSSSNACLSEVASLKELSNLHLCIVEVERFPQDYPLIKHPTKLKKFRFSICGRHLFNNYPELNPDEFIRYMEIVGCSLIPEWALMLLPETTHLKLKNCKGQEALNRGGGFPSLKYLKVEECDDVEFVVSAKESPENAFGNLQSLELRKLPNLKKVITKYEEGLLPTLLFHNLKKIVVAECPELKHLLPSVLLQGMDNLTDVRVSDCGGMEHLFDGPPTVEQRNVVLSKLRCLRLYSLTSMTSIWPMGLVVKLQNLTILDVQGCHGLKKSVVSAMKGGLPNLYRLSVNYCGGVEEIISDVVDNEALLPKLENLILSSLPELVRIYGGGEAIPPPQLDWHSLKTIEVHRCPKLKKVQPLQGGADSVPSLQEIKGERNWWEGLDWEGNDRVSLDWEGDARVNLDWEGANDIVHSNWEGDARVNLDWEGADDIVNSDRERDAKVNLDWEGGDSVNSDWEGDNDRVKLYTKGDDGVNSDWEGENDRVKLFRKGDNGVNSDWEGDNDRVKLYTEGDDRVNSYWEGENDKVNLDWEGEGGVNLDWEGENDKVNLDWEGEGGVNLDWEGEGGVNLDWEGDARVLNLDWEGDNDSVNSVREGDARVLNLDWEGDIDSVNAVREGDTRVNSDWEGDNDSVNLDQERADGVNSDWEGDNDSVNLDRERADGVNSDWEGDNDRVNFYREGDDGVNSDREGESDNSDGEGDDSVISQLISRLEEVEPEYEDDWLKILRSMDDAQVLADDED